MPSLLASIPSPDSGAFDLGPLTIHMYGLTLLVGILLATWLTAVRWRKLGGDSDLVLRVAVGGVAAGVIGARLYHVLTSWSEVPDPKWKGILEIWNGGLGVWGGILAGTIVGAIIIRRGLRADIKRFEAEIAEGEARLAARSGSEAELSALADDTQRVRARLATTRNLSVYHFMDAVAPGLLLAQGIGRIGNWFNQELYGKPTDLPWGLEIDPSHFVGTYVSRTYHPTFLYELIWDLVGVALLIWVGRRWVIRPPALFALYVSYYTFGRFFEELLRVDHAHEWGPLRLNAWVSIFLFIGSTAFFIWWQVLGRGGTPTGYQRRMPWRRTTTKPAPKMAVPERPRPGPRLASGGMAATLVGELELDLDAFEGPFDLLLSLILRDELPLREVDLAEIVLAFVERLAERDELDLDACGEFLVLISALLELKARALFPDEEAELSELEPEQAAEELARRLAEYRRAKEGAAWLAERLDAGRDRFFRLGPAPLAPARPEPRFASQKPEKLGDLLRLLAVEPQAPSTAHMALRFPPVAQFVERWRSLLRRRARIDFDHEVAGLSRVEVAVAFLALLELSKQGELELAQAAPFAPIRISRPDVERRTSWNVRSA